MFYSHEVLTSRKYGVATVWLVATIGSKSNLKKVNRKAILDVDVKKACDTIIFPEAPMALRLQSNLLYGVSRVYSQQCGYVLTDAQKAQDAMRNLLRFSKSNELDPDAGKARPEQLMLMDDPAFMPDLALPPLDFDLTDLDVGPGESQNSLLSPNSRRRASSTGSSRASSVLGLRISNSSGNSRGTYQLPDINDDPFAAIGSSARKVPGLNLNLGGRGLDDEELGLEEVDWEFDDEGNEVAIQGSGGAATFREKLLSGSAASGAVRREHEEGQALRGPGSGVFDEEGDLNMMMGEEDEFGGHGQNLGLDPNAEAFPIAAAAANSRDNTAEEDEFEPSSDSAEARQKKTRKARKKKTIAADQTLVLTRREIKDMADNYLDIMQREAKAQQVKELKKVAKTNARTWIFGDGIGGIGRGIGEGKTPSPLEIFSGDALMAAIMGIPLSDHSSSPKRGGPSSAADGSDAEGRRVRPRLGDDDIDMDAVARGDDIQPLYDDEGMEIEVGREAQSALDDHMSSAMPWNMSGGARNPSSSIQGGTGGRGYMSGSLRHSSVRGENQYQLGSQIGRTARDREGSRLTSASPLFGRGSGRGIMALEHGSDDVIMAEDDQDFGPNTQERQAAEEFEIFGPTAQVDTQTAGQSQWIAEALDRESFNFLDFVKNAVVRKEVAKGKGKAVATADDIENDGLVGFEELIPAGEQSVMVAAQAFLHVLSLATKGLLGVKQEEEVGGFGEIKMWVFGGVDVDEGLRGMPEEGQDEDEDMGVVEEDVDELAL